MLKLKLVAPAAKVTVLKPSVSTKPDALRPLIEPDTATRGDKLLLSPQAAKVIKAAAAARRDSRFFISIPI